MSLTEAEHVFAGIHENGLNDFLRTLFTARPHYLRYGSPAFVPASTASVTQIAAISFPGIPGGVQWAVEFDIPRIDLFKASAPLPPPLTLAANQFALSTTVRLTIGCETRDQRPNPHEERPRPSRGQPLHTTLGLWAVGHPVIRNVGGEGSLTFAVDAVELVDVKPDDLESVLECLIRMLLQGALAQVSLPLHALRAGAFSLVLQRGPNVVDDQLKVYGTT